MNPAPKPELADNDRDLILLEQIEQNPDATQATLAAQLGVAVGTINWHLKRLIAKGYLKARRVQRRKLRYIITPEGLALRARLTIDFIQSSFRLYRLVRERSISALVQVEKAGHSRIILDGEGDVAEICRLTCLEKGIKIQAPPGVLVEQEIPTEHRSQSDHNHTPILHVQGLKVFIEWEKTDQFIPGE